MIGLVTITHGKFADGILDALELIGGPQEQVKSVSLHEGDDMDAFKEKIYNAITEVNSGEGVLVFVDLFGASPFNAVGSQLSKLQTENIDVRVITGLNLPMLLDASLSRNNQELDELYKATIETGKESIVELKDSMGM